MIVDLGVLKTALGIADDDLTEDETLLDQESRAAAYVEEQLERRFQPPEERVEYLMGTGTRSLYLGGRVESETVVVEERYPGSTWQDFDADDFDFRQTPKVAQLVRTDGAVWIRGCEYKCTYDDGYAEAPADIQALVIDLVTIERNSAALAIDDAPVKSESIGDFSYTLDTSVVGGATALSKNSSETLNRWRRKHI